jgi:DDE superfamily endonuclease
MGSWHWGSPSSFLPNTVYQSGSTPVADQRGRLALDYLPAYAPELNPVEYIWGYWKHHELPNFCPHDFSQLSYHARHTLRRMRRRPMLVMAFWQQANLFPL